MIDIQRRDIKALEEENSRLRKVLEEALEGPTPMILLLDRKELERINHQLTALMSLARQLYEQNEISKHHTDNVSADLWLRHPSTL